MLTDDLQKIMQMVDDSSDSSTELVIQWETLVEQLVPVIDQDVLLSMVDSVTSALDEKEKINQHIKAILQEVINYLESSSGTENINSEDLEIMANLATELDASENPILRRQASVLDQILLTISTPKGAVAAIKKAEKDEIDRLKEKYQKDQNSSLYEEPKKSYDRMTHAAEAIEAIQKKIKEYRPLEVSLSTRSCPDHPGAGLIRVSDGIYQCSLDKKIYNFHEGYTTLKGNKVPGGEVANQTQTLYQDGSANQTVFSTRESRNNN